MAVWGVEQQSEAHWYPLATRQAEGVVVDREVFEEES